MTQWYKPLILSSLLCIPWTASARSECEELFPSLDRTERQIQFIKDRDQLIGHFSPEKNAALIANAIRHSTAASDERVVKNALWLRDVPVEIIRHAKELNLTQEEALEIAAGIEAEIVILEKKAICYHFGELEHYDGERLMMLKLYDNVNIEEGDSSEYPIAFGYFTTTTDGNSSEVVHLTYPGNCSNRSCHFTNAVKEDIKGTAIRLVHHPEAVETMVTNLSSVVNGDPVVTDLTMLELSKTGEMFTKPEIYAAVYYYGDDVKIDDKSYDRRMMVDIPWTIQKGDNNGRTRLLTWQDQSRAHVVLMEDDRDIPFADIQKVVKLGFRAAIDFLPAGGTIINFADALGRLIDNRDTKGDDTLVAVLEGWQKNDLIDELVLERSFDQGTPQPGANGKAVFHLSNMYKEAEPAEASATAPPETEEHNETVPVTDEKPEEPSSETAPPEPVTPGDESTEPVSDTKDDDDTVKSDQEDFGNDKDEKTAEEPAPETGEKDKSEL